MPGDDVCFRVEASYALEKGSSSGTLLFSKGSRWLAFSSSSIYWIEPGFGNSTDVLPQKIRFLLWRQDDGDCFLLIPAINVELRGIKGGIVFDILEPLEKGVSAARLFSGSDPVSLFKKALSREWNNNSVFPFAGDQKFPEFAKGLGWCTWDAFYTDVDEEKLLAGLSSFKEHDFPLGFVILDDGWLQTKSDKLSGFTPDEQKFPNGFDAIIKKAKEQYGVGFFGVWHALAGYWSGVSPENEFTDSYKLLDDQVDLRPWENGNSHITFIHPDDIKRFFNVWHGYLKKEGVDFLKVDVQAAVGLLKSSPYSNTENVLRYQQALQDSVKHNFNNRVIYCMAHSPDIVASIQRPYIWRNSQDYFPEEGASAQQSHVRNNILNNLWSSCFGFPDWDMFQSHGIGAEFHGAARAISGGPIYICDKPGKQNFPLLWKLCTTDGKILLCDRSGLPAAGQIFIDCVDKEKKLLKIHNRSANVGILGVFHVHKTKAPIKDVMSPEDIPDISGEDFAVYSHRQKSLDVLNVRQELEVCLQYFSFDLFTISPVMDGVFAPLGLLDKFNSPAAIKECTELSSTSFRCVLIDGGRAGFYAASEPQKIEIGGIMVEYTFNQNSKLLEVEIPPGREVELLISF